MVQFEGVFPLKSSHLTGNTSFQANGTLCLDWKPGFSCANLKLGLIINSVKFYEFLPQFFSGYFTVDTQFRGQGTGSILVLEGGISQIFIAWTTRQAEGTEGS